MHYNTWAQTSDQQNKTSELTDQIILTVKEANTKERYCYLSNPISTGAFFHKQLKKFPEVVLYEITSHFKSAEPSLK